MANECGEEILSCAEAEDVALARAIAEGLSTGCASEQDVIEALQEGPQATMVEGHTSSGRSEVGADE